MKLARAVLGAALILLSACASAPKAPEAASDSYALPTPPPEPAAQQAEMVALFNDVCLQAFPNDRAVAQILQVRHAQQLTPAQVTIYLHEDPGAGWRWRGAAASYVVTLEQPPFHACAIRTLVSGGGFASLQPYIDLATRYENGRAAPRQAPVNMVIGNVRTQAIQEDFRATDGGRETLMVLSTQPLKPGEHSGTEVRFVHQKFPPETQ